MNYLYTREEIIAKAKELHGDRHIDGWSAFEELQEMLEAETTNVSQK